MPINTAHPALNGHLFEKVGLATINRLGMHALWYNEHVTDQWFTYSAP